MSTCRQRLAAGAMMAVAGVAGAWADSAPPEAAPAGGASTAPPVVLFIGNSHIGTQVPDVLTQLINASTPPLKISPRVYLRGSHALSDHWQRPSQPPKGGSLLSWIRYPDPPPARRAANHAGGMG